MTIWSPRLAPGASKYIALADAIAADVSGGKLRPGDRLPTHRDLADALRVTVGTVSRGYAEARRRGHVLGEVGRGTFVRGSVAAPTPEADGADGLVDLSVNHPAVLAPLVEETALRGALTSLAGIDDLAALLRYPPDGGAPRHREAGAAWIGLSGLEAPAGRVVVCSGSQ